MDHEPQLLQRNSRDDPLGPPTAETLGAIAETVRKARRLLLFSHENPDGDSLGSQAALALALRSLGVTVRSLLARPVPEKFRPLFPARAFEVCPDPGKPEPGDVAFLLDASDPRRSGPFHSLLGTPGLRRICMDHHPLHGLSGFDPSLVVPEAPSTGNLVLALLDHMGAVWTPEITRALWVALATDTGWFRFKNTTPWALRDAARLASAGVDTEEVYKVLYADFPPAWLRVLGEVLAGLRVELGGALVWSSVSRGLLDREALVLADLDGMVDHLKAVRGAEVIAFIVEVEGGRYKVSLRSMGDGEVESLARSLGGGGHAKAAGFRFAGSLEELVSILVREVGARQQLPGS
jgi:phosphoesterase RecJ-like protein